MCLSFTHSHTLLHWWHQDTKRATGLTIESNKVPRLLHFTQTVPATLTVALALPPWRISQTSTAALLLTSACSIILVLCGHGNGDGGDPLLDDKHHTQLLMPHIGRCRPVHVWFHAWPCVFSLKLSCLVSSFLLSISSLYLTYSFVSGEEAGRKCRWEILTVFSFFNQLCFFILLLQCFGSLTTPPLYQSLSFSFSQKYDFVLGFSMFASIGDVLQEAV